MTNVRQEQSTRVRITETKAYEKRYFVRIHGEKLFEIVTRYKLYVIFTVMGKKNELRNE